MNKPKKSTAKPKEELTPDKIYDEIRKRAQEIFNERGNKPGDALSDWLQAEKEIKKKYKVKK